MGEGLGPYLYPHSVEVILISMSMNISTAILNNFNGNFFTQSNHLNQYWCTPRYSIVRTITNCKRSGASSPSRASFQSYGTFKERDISQTIDFFDMAYKTKIVSFWPYNRYPWLTGPARPDPSMTPRLSRYFEELLVYSILKQKPHDTSRLLLPVRFFFQLHTLLVYKHNCE